MACVKIFPEHPMWDENLLFTPVGEYDGHPHRIFTEGRPTPPPLPGCTLYCKGVVKVPLPQHGTIVTITFYTIIMIKVVVRKTWKTLQSIWFFASNLAVPLSPPFLTNVAKKMRISREFITVDQESREPQPTVDLWCFCDILTSENNKNNKKYANAWQNKMYLFCIW